MTDVFLNKAKEFENKANKKLKSGNFITNLFSNSDEKYEEACELFKQAGQNYKLAGQYE